MGPRLFIDHARNAPWEDFWGNKNFKHTGLWDGEDDALLGCTDIDHSGISMEVSSIMARTSELTASYIPRLAISIYVVFRPSWGGVDAITSNPRISHCTVLPNLCEYPRIQVFPSTDPVLSLDLSPVNTPMKMQNQYQRMPCGLRPTLRLPCVLDRDGLQLLPLFELRDKKAICCSLSESLKSTSRHEWQAALRFTPQFCPTYAAILLIFCHNLSSSMLRPTCGVCLGRSGVSALKKSERLIPRSITFCTIDRPFSLPS